MRPPHRPILLSLVLALVLLPAMSGLATEAAKWPPGNDGDGRNVVTLFVHGVDIYDRASTDCGDWDSMTSPLSQWGNNANRFYTLKYYGHDENCRNDIHKYGSHSAHYASGHVYENNGHNQEASIRHLGYHFAWYKYRRFTQKGRPVQIVSHSMGGLIARYALAQIERGHPKFPSYVEVQDVVTLGTPHDGAGFARLCGWSRECDEMVPGSDFMDWVDAYAQHPNPGTGYTDWTCVGSHADDLVEPNSAVHMDADHKVKYFTGNGIEHGDYDEHAASCCAGVEWWDRDQPWYEWHEAPWPVRWTDYALYHYRW